MDYIPVSSSTLEAVGFDEETQTLGVTFRNGTEYRYSNVPISIFESIRSAASPGRAFDESVRKAGFPFFRFR
jgi:hypothetical protein